MSRLIRKGLDNLGKALRETGQALDRVGLEALGSDSHKELCKSIVWDAGLLKGNGVSIDGG